MKIAHFGTFDVENYGDLLFPLILERRLSDLVEEFVHVSPVGGPPVWRDCVSTVSFEGLLQDHPNLDAAIVGGGGIVQTPIQTVADYDRGGLSSSYAYPSLWLGAGYVSAGEGIPLCWNAPGVLSEFDEVSARLAEWTASVTDYLAVRDEASRERLQRAGVDRPVEVVPDTALEVSRLWTEDELREAYSAVLERQGAPMPERSVVFHLNSRYLNEGRIPTAARLDRICRRLEATPVLIAIGPCHGDGELQRRVALEMETEPVLVDRPQSLVEVAACIAHSEAYIGSSMHGAVTAYSFGKPGLLVAAKSLTKFQGLLEQFDLSRWQAETWEEAEHRARDVVSAPAGTWSRVLREATPRLDRHWDRLRAAIMGEESALEAADKSAAIGRLHRINTSHLDERGVFQGVVAGNFFKAREELSRRAAEKEVLLGQLERANRERARFKDEAAHLTGWMEEMNESVPALLNSRQWKFGYAVGEVYRRITRTPRPPMAHEHLTNMVAEYRSWKSGRGSGTEARVPLPGRDVAAGGRAEKVRRLTADPQGVAREAAAAARTRLAREARKLRPRKQRDELAREVRQRLGPVPELPEWPGVSIVVSGATESPTPPDPRNLKRLLRGLEEHTDYPDFEVVLVDSGGLAGLAGSLGVGFPVRSVEAPLDATLWAARSVGAAAATGELLLFFDVGIEPFEAGWLKELVASLEGSGAGAVGAYLIQAHRTGDPVPSGYTLGHRGVKFRNSQGIPRAYSLGDGEDTLGPHLGTETACPTVDGACLLVSRSTFASVGGGSVAGLGSSDPGLRLTAAGRTVVASGRSTLLHHGRRTSEKSTPGPATDLPDAGLHRRYLLDRLSGERVWSEEPAHIAITVSSLEEEDGFGDWYTAHEMGDALEEAGWRVTYVQRQDDEWYDLPEDVDYVLALLHWYDPRRTPGVTTIAWIRNWTERWAERAWFDHFDVVLVSSEISREIIERRTHKATHLFPIATNPARFSRAPPSPDYAADYVFSGNHWGAEKGEQRLVNSLDVRPGERVRIFGKGWEHVPRAAPYAGGHLPYDQLPRVYSSSRLVIDDAGSTTRPYGSVNSRVFDALATGTLVVSSCKEGVRELFDNEFPTYGDRRELRENLDRLLRDDDYRERLADRYRQTVLREHTYAKRAEQLTQLLKERAEALSFAIKIGPRNWERAPSWGDLHYARALQRQLERRGHPCRVQVLEEWDDPEGLAYDVALHLKGLSPYATKPGQFNVLWNISHPELVTAEECDRYDLIFVASERFAGHLGAGTRPPVLVLQQAADPGTFFPDPDPAHEHELVFVGNSRKVERRILRDLLPTDRDLAVWGKDWAGIIDEEYVLGEYLPNNQVRRAYSTAAIVLNDHWDDMREHGFVSNRIYDALACGAFVISDHLPEIERTFGDTVVTYETPEELQALVEHYLAFPQEREERGRRGRELVRRQHTFDHRAQELLQRVRQHRKFPESSERPPEKEPAR